MKFLDEAKIYVKSGDGGPGCVSFHREKFVEFGGPDGGDGGKGGDIIFECVKDVNTLIDFRYTQHFRAANGQHGMGRNRSGSSAPDLVIKIPVGTEILSDDKETVLLDMTEPGQRIVFLKGGDGGFGNAHYKTATNQAPRKRLPGWPGSDEIGLWLRLKLIADVGLLGMPNAGKSTFLSRVTAAKPKIADYPFTTLHPNLGVVKSTGREFVIADIPGLIEGASEGHGLGTRFLGHVERTSVLLHLIDVTQDDPAAAYKMLRKELKEYGGGLYNKPEIIALNKADAVGMDLAEDVAKTFAKKTKKKPHVISAVAGMGMEKLLKEIADAVSKGRAAATAAE
ncbi:MAG: GTPase ObgE [Alphaproteobacteria bacterium]|nr:GTPase ObgE [Alphaproteobacteria bacterium]